MWPEGVGRRKFLAWQSSTGDLIGRDCLEINKLRVLAIVPSGCCFGLQNLTLAFFARLHPRVQCHFLNTRWSDGEFSRRLSELGIPHSATWFGMFSRRLDPANLKMTLACLWKLPVAYFDFLRLYWRFRPTTIYLANHHEVILLWPLLILFRRQVICHIHDPPPALAFQKISFFFWRRAVGRFLFISENTRERLSWLGALTDRDRVVHNGVEVRELTLPRRRSRRFCQEFGWPDTALVVGLTGQMSAHKGHEDFLAAARLLKERNSNLRFVIAGRQHTSFFSRLRQLVLEWGIDRVVGFPGWLPQAQEFFEAIDIFVLASRHEEGFGLVVAEAGERGVPVVCTRSGGALEIVIDGRTGILVDKNHPEQIALAIERLAEDPRLAAEMGVAGRQRVSQDFNLACQAALFEKFLADIHDH